MGNKIGKVKCSVIFDCNNYESVDEITRYYFTYDDTQYVGIVNKWIKSRYDVAKSSNVFFEIDIAKIYIEGSYEKEIVVCSTKHRIY